jgi:hypothetical protein
MRVLLRKVTIKKKLNTADQLQWINAVETKLKLINWDGVSRVRSEILTVNNRLFNLGQSRFHNTTLQFMLTIATDDVEERWAISEDRVIYLEGKLLQLQSELKLATERLNSTLSSRCVHPEDTNPASANTGDANLSGQIS